MNLLITSYDYEKNFVFILSILFILLSQATNVDCDEDRILLKMVSFKVKIMILFHFHCSCNCFLMIYTINLKDDQEKLNMT